MSRSNCPLSLVLGNERDNLSGAARTNENTLSRKDRAPSLDQPDYKMELNGLYNKENGQNELYHTEKELNGLYDTEKELNGLYDTENCSMESINNHIKSQNRRF